MSARATIIVDLGNGDGGKGTMTDYLSRRAENPIVVRFNGGGQAAHNVVLPNGVHHTFSMYGSGSFAGAPTHLSRHVLVNPLALANEALALRPKLKPDPLRRMTIDLRCRVVTPWHVEANRARETNRAEFRHGSCGSGIGETVQDFIDGCGVRMFDLLHSRSSVMRSLKTIRDKKIAEFPQIYERCGSVGEVADAYNAILQSDLISVLSDREVLEDHPGELIFEGAQGVLIDEKHGFPPYHTWSNCTYDNAVEILRDIHYNGEIKKLGVLRSFAVRHGLGPLPTENTQLGHSFEGRFLEHNKTSEWQGPLRIGWFDIPLSEYAIRSCGGIDALAITCLDRLTRGKICIDRKGCVWTGVSQYRGCKKNEYLKTISRILGVPIGYESYGPTWQDKKAVPV